MKLEVEDIEKKVFSDQSITDSTDTVDADENLEQDTDESSTDSSEDLTELTDDVTTQDTSEDLTADTHEEESNTQEKTKRTSWKTEAETWKKRFVNYKTSTDSKIFSLRQHIASLEKSRLELEDKISTISITSKSVTKEEDEAIAKILSEDERELLGDDVIDLIKKLNKVAVESAVAPLKKELTDAKKAANKVEEEWIQTETKSRMDVFKDKVKSLVPNYETYLGDKKFIEWMNSVDTYSPSIRADLFRAAEQLYDARRVAQFFTEYKELTTASRSNTTLDDNISPVQSATSSTISQKSPIIKRAFIDKFYDDCVKGRYRGRETERKQIEKQIESAVLQGRIAP